MMYRNKKLLDAAQEFDCQSCGTNDGTIVAAHSNQLRDGKGRSLKAHDYRIAFLCVRCHWEIDQSKLDKQTKTEMWEEAHRKTIGALFESGKLTIK